MTPTTNPMTSSIDLDRLEEWVAEAISARIAEGGTMTYRDLAKAALSVIGERDVERDALAAILIDADEFYDEPELWALNTGFGARIFPLGDGKPHDGDCTKMPYSCNRCITDEYRAKASFIIRALSASRGSGVPEGWGEPVAWLKTWHAYREIRRRVDLDPDFEPWLAHHNPTVTPLYAAPTPSGPS